MHISCLFINNYIQSQSLTYLMNRKCGAYNDEQISKVIELSLNFKHHRRIIDNMKPAINMPTINIIKKMDKLSN